VITKQEGLIQEEFFQDKKMREYLVENMNKNQPVFS
jgi:replication initiation and membrane attachment protein DnaB